MGIRATYDLLLGHGRVVDDFLLLLFLLFLLIQFLLLLPELLLVHLGNGFVDQFFHVLLEVHFGLEGILLLARWLELLRERFLRKVDLLIIRTRESLIRVVRIGGFLRSHISGRLTFLTITLSQLGLVDLLLDRDVLLLGLLDFVRRRLACMAGVLS